MVLFSQPWKCWGDFLPRPGGHPQSSSLRESMRGLGSGPASAQTPGFSHCPQRWPRRSLLLPPPSLEVALLPLHISSCPSPGPGPLCSLVERRAQRGAQPLSLWNLLPPLSMEKPSGVYYRQWRKLRAGKCELGPAAPFCRKRGSALFRGWASSCSHLSGPRMGQRRGVPRRE